MNTSGHVTAFQIGPVVMLWCSECGPMGVSEGQDSAMMTVRNHIREQHGVEEQQ